MSSKNKIRTAGFVILFAFVVAVVSFKFFILLAFIVLLLFGARYGLKRFDGSMSEKEEEYIEKDETTEDKKMFRSISHLFKSDMFKKHDGTSDKKRKRR